MRQRIAAIEAPVLARPMLKLRVQQPSVETATGAAKTPSQRVLKLQRAIGNRAVQRILSRQPDSDVADKGQAPATGNKPAVSSADKGALAVETTPTDWYLDSWGVGSDIGGRAGRRDSRPDDVLMVEGLKIGSGRNSKIFEQAGNALRSGRSRLGSFDHSKGAGNVNGVVKYISQREINVNFKPNLPPESGPLDKAAKAQRQAVEAETKKMLLDLIRKEDNELSGNWDEMEKKAAAAAAEQLPGSKPEVKIDTKVQHTGHRLETTQYQIDKPSACTIKIIVPTSTTTYQVHGGQADTTTIAAGASGSSSQSQKIDMGWEIKTWIQKTKSSFIETVNSLHEQIKSNGPGEISSDKGSDKGSDPSLTARAKKWLKDKASGLWEKAKSTIIDKGISLLKNRLTKWILKGLELESYIEIKLAEWFVDWLGDKAGDKLKEWLVKGKRGPNVQKPCNPVSTTPGPSGPDSRMQDKCPGPCHHPDPNRPPVPQSPLPVPTRPGPVLDPCPPETQPPLLRSDDHEIDLIFSQSTTEIVSTAEHTNLELSKEESQSGYAEGKVVHHTEHYYSGPVTKETVGHPAIEVIVEQLS